MINWDDIWQRYAVPPLKNYEKEEFEKTGYRFRYSYFKYEMEDDPWYMKVYWRIHGLIPPYDTGSSGSTVFGFKVYGGRHSKKKWFKPLKWWFYNVMMPVDHFLYAVKWLFNRTDRLKLDGIPKYSWCDRDEIMFHACFAVLRDYVEKELGKANKDTHPECQYKGYRLHSNDEEAIDLYLWYRDQLPIEERYYKYDTMKRYLPKLDISDLPVRPADQKYQYDGLGKLKNKKLQELIDMRRTLWT